MILSAPIRRRRALASQRNGSGDRYNVCGNRGLKFRKKSQVLYGFAKAREVHWRKNL